MAVWLGWLASIGATSVYCVRISLNPIHPQRKLSPSGVWLVKILSAPVVRTSPRGNRPRAQSRAQSACPPAYGRDFRGGREGRKTFARAEPQAGPKSGIGAARLRGDLG